MRSRSTTFCWLGEHEVPTGDIFLRFEISGFFLMLFTVFRQASLNRIVFSNGFSTRFTNTCYLQCVHRLTDCLIAIYMQSAAHAKFSLFFTGI